MQDGPNPDAKEQLGGFMILELPSLDHALDWGARCPAASGGAVEIRPLSPRFGDSIDTALATFALGWHYRPASSLYD